MEQLYLDCSGELPREMSLLLQLYRASHWLGIEELENRCDLTLVISAANLRLVLELLGDIPAVRVKCLNYVKSHLKEAALLLAPEQLSALLADQS